MDDPGGKLTRYATHIHHGGCNILGLIEIFLLIAGMWALSESVGHLNRGVGVAICLGLLLSIPATDLRIRLTQPEQSRWSRLLSPSLGGCLLWLPVWLLFPAGAVAGIVAAILQHR